MPIPCYLALTAAEFANTTLLPEKIAWMACHFSCYGTGLSNLPKQLPEGSLIILNDRTPADKHDPSRILAQLSELEDTLKPDGFLLDFQRNDMAFNKKIAQILTEELSSPVGVTAQYAEDLNCPIFLEPPPLHMALTEYTASWAGREIWLDAALETRTYTVTADGCKIEDADNTCLPEPVFMEESLFCRYHTELLEDAAIFTLQRTKEDLNALLEQIFGISRAVGLYQQLGISET